MADQIPVWKTEWSSGKEEDSFIVYNPVDGTPYVKVMGSDSDGVKACVKASDEAFRKWKKLSPHERGKYCKQAAIALKDYAEEIARIETEEVGKPIDVSRADVRRCIEAFDFFGGLVGNIPSDLYELGVLNAEIYQEPFGVVAGIIPFNWPPLHTGAKIAPAVAAGNTIILKPGDQAPLSVMKIVEVVQTVFPENVVELVAGPGIKAGQVLTTDPLVKKISFTGSDNGGRAIIKQSADNLTPCVMELGGKNAFVAFDDCDIDRAVATAFEGAFYNNGEACTATSRILVDRKILQEFTDKFIAMMDNLVVGDGLDPKTSVGPVVTKAHMDKIMSFIDIGVKEGATLAKQVPVPSDGRMKK